MSQRFNRLSSLSSSTNSLMSSDAEMEDVEAVKPQSGTLKKYQSMFNIFSEPSPSVTVSDIRTLTSKYQTLLDQATKEIQKLNKVQKSMKKEKTKLLATNVEMAKELTKIYTEQKQWREAEKGLLKANEELVAEVESLYAKQESLGEENDMLLKTITILGEEKVQQKEDLSEKIEELQNSVKSLEEEKANQDVIVKTLSSENTNHIAQLRILKKAEKNVVELRNENEQMKFEKEFLTASQKNTSDKMDILRKEYEDMRKELKDEKEKVKNLSVWRKQVTEKNESLVMENNQLRQKSENLQRIVDEEVGDIDNILSTIRQLQGTRL